jgi:hypothetical protein
VQTYVCTYCINAADILTNTANQIKDSSDSVFGSMNTTAQDVSGPPLCWLCRVSCLFASLMILMCGGSVNTSQVKRLLVDGQAQLQQYTGDAYAQVLDAKQQVGSVRDDAAKAMDDYVRPYEEYRSVHPLTHSLCRLFCLPGLTLACLHLV